MRFYFFMVGVALLLGSGWLFFRRLMLVWHGVVAVGRIESYEARVHSDDDGKHYTHYYPVVAFKDSRRRTRRITASMPSSRKRPAVGTKVEVIFRPNDPDYAQILSFRDLWFIPLLLAVLGSLCIYGTRQLWD